MKRGLVTLDPTEVSQEEWEGRLEAVRTRLRRDGLHAALIYGNVYRSDDIAYLTNLCLYWNEGILAVPADGEPTFLTKLSKRVHPWMRETSIVRDLRSGRRLPQLVVDLLANAQPTTVGIVDRGWWPAELVDELEAQLANWTLRPLDDLVREARVVPSESELTLLSTAGGILTAATEQAMASGLEDPERIAVVEKVTRSEGFKDVLARCEHAEAAVSIEVVGEYRNGWIKVARATGAEWIRSLESGLAAATARLIPGVRPRELAEAATTALNAIPACQSAELGCVNQADLSTGGDYRTLTDADAPVPEGAVVALSLELKPGSGRRAVVADTYLVRADGTVRLTERRRDASVG